jgi:O-antigen ligase
MAELGIILVIEGLLLGAVIILREPKLLVPCVVLMLPFEYLQTQTLDTLGKGGTGGMIRTMLNPGKAAMAAAVIAAAWRYRYEPGRLIPNSSIIVPVFLLAGVVTLAAAWSYTQRPDNTVSILPLYVAFVCAAPSLIDNRQDIERIAGALLIAAIMVSLVAIAQRALGLFEWRAYLINSDDFDYRSNATFADPNNLARFLNMALVLAAGLILVTGPRRLTVYLAIPAVVVGLPALMTTGSRSGWLGFVLAGFLIVLVAPVGWYPRLRLFGYGAAGLVGGIALLGLQGGAEFDRIKTFTDISALLGQREHLIRAGWEMWKDSPYIGLGTGSYHNSLRTAYEWVLPWWTETTLSHTTVITFLAEGGLLAMAMLGFVMVRVGIVMVRTYRSAEGAYAKLFVGWCGVSLFLIFMQSQAEGRLMEEPYLWAIFGIFAAIELGKANREPGEPEVVTPDRAPSTPPATARAGEPGMARTGSPA